MNRSLRQRHQAIVGGLGLMVPLILVAGIVARKPVPMLAQMPSALADRPGSFGTVIWTRSDIWSELDIRTSLRRESAGEVAVELTVGGLAKPDVLVYWAPGDRTPPRDLPDNVRLLGALVNRASMALPTEFRGEVGRLLLYSLANHELLAVSAVFRVPKD